MVEHKKYEKTKKDEKDRTKKLHDSAIGPGNKKGVRGADGKWVAPATDGEAKDETDDEKTEDKLTLDEADDMKSKRALEHDDEMDASAMKRRKLEEEEESDF